MNPKQLHPLTKYINSKQKAASKQAKDAATQWLIQQFPQIFETSQQIRPLKCGIIEDILACNNSAEISKTKLRQAVAKFTRSIEYLACLKAQEMRVDISGQPAVPVTEEEAQQAAEKLKQYIEKQAQFNSTEKNIKTNTKNILEAVENEDSERAYYNAENSKSQSKTEITIKPKKRTLDEAAIIRMREKLGLKSS